MSEPTGTYTTNDDGSLTVELEGKSTKFVKESDLLAVKGGAERKESELLAQIAESNRLKDETHNQLLQVQATNEQLDGQAKESATHKQRVGELEGELNAATEGRRQLEEELLGMRRTHLATGYNVSEESLKDKTADQLKNLEEALKLTGGKTPAGKPANIDGLTPGGTGAPVPLGVLEQAKAELKFVREHKSANKE